MPAVRPRYQIDSLTSTRAVAAIMVFIHHFGREIFPFNKWPKVFSSGNLAVSYFFVLSGFVLYIGYNSKNFSYGDFLKRRVARIVPIYEIALFLAVFLAVHYHQYDLTKHHSIKEVVYSALLIQSYIPSYPLILNLPAWTISVEMFFYFLFPLFLWVERKSFKIFAAITVVLFALSQYYHFKYFVQRHYLPDEIVDTVFFSPEIHLSQFLIGMIGGKLFYNIRDNVPRIKLLPLFLFAITISVIAWRPEHISYHVGLIAPLFMLLILSVAINDPKTLNARFFIFLGEVSYGIYILQMPLYSFLDTMNAKHLHLSKQPFFWFALCFVIVAASVSYLFIESPIRKRINAITLKRKSTAYATRVHRG